MPGALLLPGAGSASYAPMTPAGSCAATPSPLAVSTMPHSVSVASEHFAAAQGSFSALSASVHAGPGPHARAPQPAAYSLQVHLGHQRQPHHQPGSPFAPCSPHGVEACPPSTLCYAYMACQTHDASACAVSTRATSPHTPGTSCQVAPRVGATTPFGSPDEERFPGARTLSVGPLHYDAVEVQGETFHASSSSSGADGALHAASVPSGSAPTGAAASASASARRGGVSSGLASSTASAGEFVAPPRAVGQDRIAKIERYRRKRANRLSPNVVRYQCRRTHAQSRPRVHGRFFTAKKEDQ